LESGDVGLLVDESDGPELLEAKVAEGFHGSFVFMPSAGFQDDRRRSRIDFCGGQFVEQMTQACAVGEAPGGVAFVPRHRMDTRT
jgi:hypothetical protein